MKRSEALRRIKKYFFTETDQQADMQAEIMLNFFERNLEMVPTLITTENRPGQFTTKTTFGKWEPEDA